MGGKTLRNLSQLKAQENNFCKYLEIGFKFDKTKIFFVCVAKLKVDKN